MTFGGSSAPHCHSIMERNIEIYMVTEKRGFLDVVLITQYPDLFLFLYSYKSTMLILIECASLVRLYPLISLFLEQRPKRCSTLKKKSSWTQARL